MAETLRQAERLLPRPWRLHAYLRSATRFFMAAMRSSAAGFRSPLARRSPTKAPARSASPPASSAMARSMRARSTKALNLASLWQLPVLFLCENNLYAMGTALKRAEAETHIAAKARGYHVDAASGGRHGCRGGRSAATRAVERMRANRSSPVLLEFRTYRFRAHSMFDAQLYRQIGNRGLAQKDPIIALQSWLRGSRHAQQDDCSDRGAIARRDRRRPLPLPKPAPGSRSRNWNASPPRIDRMNCARPRTRRAQRMTYRERPQGRDPRRYAGGPARLPDG